MAFTTSDRFAVVGIGTLDLSASQIGVYVRNANGDVFRYHFAYGEHPTPVVGTQNHTDWLILQDTWALNNGF